MIPRNNNDFGHFDTESLKLKPIDNPTVTGNDVTQEFALVAPEKSHIISVLDVENKIRSFLANNRKESAENLPHRKFNQGILINELLQQGEKYHELMRFILQFNGLCELICNYVIMEDLLGDSAKNLDQASYKTAQFGEMKVIKKQIFLSYLQNENFFKDKITLSKLNNPEVKNSHILLVTSIFQKMGAYFLNIYPHSLVSFEEQAKLLHPSNQLNTSLVEAKLQRLNEGEYVKFHVFNKTLFRFEGHSCLIKKTDKDKYSFFDPNHGEFQHLDIHKLIDRLNKAVINHKGNQVCFIDAKAYLQHQHKMGM